jgi:hypothetical protein
LQKKRNLEREMTSTQQLVLLLLQKLFLYLDLRHISRKGQMGREGRWEEKEEEEEEEEE